ncbi:MAG TPA: ABC transporter permease [Bacteroidia bacterium]|nr:ABC transporter permease [Bacteroidia bacterium]HRG52084.1 ABC transporter permease [Bacteroidia bacterium]
MIQFILKRLMYGFLVLIGVITIVFLLFNVLPGDPARMMLGQRADLASVEAINKDLGRNRSLSTQFFMYLNDLSPISVHDPVHADHYLYLSKQKYSYSELFSAGSKVVVIKYPYFRRSYITKRKVADILIETLPETAVLAFSSIVFGAFFGILLGVLSAIKKNTWIDRCALVFATLGTALPSFFVGLLLIWLFGYVLLDYTGLHNIGTLFITDDFGDEHLELKNIILPTLTLGLRPLAIIIQLTRSSLLDVLSQDYIRTATAKGLSYYKVIFKHALKNALNPVVTAISGWFAGLMAGAIFVEMIFNWKGIGYEVVDALNKNDLPVVMGATLIFAIIFVLINIVVDIIYGVLDPRVRAH